MMSGYLCLLTGCILGLIISWTDFFLVEEGVAKEADMLAYWIFSRIDHFLDRLLFEWSEGGKGEKGRI